MLPTNFNARLNEMMDVKLEEITEKTQETFSRDSADMAHRGMLHSSNTLGLYQKKRLAQINRRAEAVLECQTRLISTMKIQVSDTLASELKNQVEAWVSDEWCERSIQTDLDLGLVKDYKPEFREEALRTRNSAIKKRRLKSISSLMGCEHKRPHMLRRSLRSWTRNLRSFLAQTKLRTTSVNGQSNLHQSMDRLPFCSLTSTNLKN